MKPKKMTTAPTFLSPNDILLDPENPRLCMPSGATQDQVRTTLIESHDVIALAKRIQKDGFDDTAERVVVIKEHGKWVVVEGNCRVCACQILLNPNLLPEEDQGRIGSTSPEVLKTIKQVRIDVKPDRISILPILARRHTGAGAVPWRPAAVASFIGKLFEKGNSIVQIAELMKLPKNKISKRLFEYQLLEETKRAPGLSTTEKAKLNDVASLKANPFTRLFTLEDPARLLKVKLKPDGSLEHSEFSDKKEFRGALLDVARLTLFPTKGNTDPEIDTRTPTSTAMSRIASKNKAIARIHKAGTKPKPVVVTGKAKESEDKSTDKSASKMGRPTLKPSERVASDPFFGDFVCERVINPVVVQLSMEIARLKSVTDYRSSAAFLLRALIENCLLHVIKVMGHFPQLVSEYKMIKGKSTSPAFGKGPNHSFILEFAKTNADTLFEFPDRARTFLGNWAKHKKICDDIIHGNKIPTDHDLHQAAADLKLFLIEICAGRASSRC